MKRASYFFENFDSIQPFMYFFFLNTRFFQDEILLQKHVFPYSFIYALITYIKGKFGIKISNIYAIY